MSSFMGFDLLDLLKGLDLGGRDSNDVDTFSELSLRQRMHLDKLALSALDSYSINRTLMHTIKSSWNKSTYRNSKIDYVQTYKAMIWFEEEKQANFLKEFNRSDIRLIRNPEKKFNIFCIKNEAKMEKIDDAINENLLDQFVLKENGCIRPKLFQGQIKGNNKEFIFIEMNEKDVPNINIKAEHTIEFQLNRLPFQVQHLGLEYVANHNLVENFIDNPLLDNPRYSNECIDLHESCSSDQSDLCSKLNEEQRKAVENIIAADNQPMPYILYGPPGTGKTATLVAAIERIVRTTNKKVLVCANSNAACDEISVRLIGVLTENELLRFYAKKFDNRKMSSEIKPFSNWNKEEFHHPALKHLLEFRVIISTLCTAACLTRAGIGSQPNHFSHIFVDECASTYIFIYYS